MTSVVKRRKHVGRSQQLYKIAERIWYRTRETCSKVWYVWSCY